MARIQVPMAFIGGGTMATAIIEGGVAGRALSPGMAVVADPDRAKHAALVKLGAEVRETATRALEWLAAREKTPGEGHIVLAVKPQTLPAVARELATTLARGPSRLVISVLAGTRIENLQFSLG